MDALRIQSESRLTASLSVRTCFTTVIFVIRTQFIPVECWKECPKFEEMTPGALEILRLAQNFFKCNVRPIDPRYLVNFDDTGGMYSAHTQEGVSNAGKKKIYVMDENGTNRDKRGTTSISRNALPGDAIVGNINTKFKFCLNAVGNFAGIVIHFSVEQLDRSFHVVPVEGLCIGGNVHASEQRVGYIVFSRKGGKGDDGVSPSEKVTEWFYTKIIQDQFIPEIRKQDPNLTSNSWEEGMDVPIEFCAVTKVDSEIGMMNVQKKEELQRRMQKLEIPR
jgi:hypothetical protein